MMKSDDKNIVMLYRVPLEKLIHSLHKIYEQGADFIDIGIVKDPNEELDELKIGYSMDYLSAEALERFNENKELSDDDIDKLTN